MSVNNPHFVLLLKIKTFERRVKNLESMVQLNYSEYIQLNEILNQLNRYKSKLVIDSFDTVITDFIKLEQRLVEELGTL